jgi:hypothetical protein
MKTLSIRSTVALFVSCAVAAALFASDEKKPAPPSASSAAKSAYPMTTCVVSGDKLDDNSMGGPIDYVYQAKGQPDRLIRFCCKDCVKDFEKEPAKYLAKLDEATAAKAKAAAKK